MAATTSGVLVALDTTLLLLRPPQQPGQQPSIQRQGLPVRLGAPIAIRQVACGKDHTACVDQRGTLWTMGANSHGQLGVGDLEPRASLTWVHTPGHWRKIGGRSLGFFSTQYKGLKPPISFIGSLQLRGSPGRA